MSYSNSRCAGKLEVTVELCTKVLAIEPGQQEARLLMASCYAKLSKFDKAIALLLQARISQSQARSFLSRVHSTSFLFPPPFLHSRYVPPHHLADAVTLRWSEPSPRMSMPVVSWPSATTRRATQSSRSRSISRPSKPTRRASVPTSARYQRPLSDHLRCCCCCSSSRPLCLSESSDVQGSDAPDRRAIS